MSDKPLKLFMVDDNRLLVDLITKDIKSFSKLQWMGSAVSGEECLEKTKHMPLDVILMDIGLPGIDGLETAEKLKKDLGENTPTIIFLTAYGDFEYAERALELRSSLLGKKIKSSLLFEKIVQIVEEEEILINPNPKGPPSEARHRAKVRRILREKLSPDELNIAALVRKGKTTQEIVGILDIKQTKVNDLRKAIFRKLEPYFGTVNAPLLATLMEYSDLCEKLSTVFPLKK